MAVLRERRNNVRAVVNLPAIGDVHALQLRAASRERHDGSFGDQVAAVEVHDLQPTAALRKRRNGDVGDTEARSVRVGHPSPEIAS